MNDERRPPRHDAGTLLRVINIVTAMNTSIASTPIAASVCSIPAEPQRVCAHPATTVMYAMGMFDSEVPEELVRAIAEVVLQAFREATDAQMLLSEIIIQYPSLRISARELRGGAIIYLAPRGPLSTATAK